MNVSLRQAKLEDFEAFYWLKSDKVNIAWSGHEQKPDRERLLLWYQTQLTNPCRTIYFAITEFNDIVGYCYVDSVGERLFDIGYGVHSSFASRGIGTCMISSVLNIVNKMGGVKSLHGYPYIIKVVEV